MTLFVLPVRCGRYHTQPIHPNCQLTNDYHGLNKPADQSIGAYPVSFKQVMPGLVPCAHSRLPHHQTAFSPPPPNPIEPSPN